MWLVSALLALLPPLNFRFYLLSLLTANRALTALTLPLRKQSSVLNCGFEETRIRNSLGVLSHNRDFKKGELQTAISTHG